MQDTVQKYLESQVMTATPQKLRLMLIEGAIRFARQSIGLWERGENEKAIEALGRCRGIISELLSGIRPDESALTRQVAGVYLFLFRTLTEAQLRRDSKKVEDTISVLEVERETWRLVCEKLPEVPVPSGSSERLPKTVEIIAPAQSIDGPQLSGFTVDA